ncbi:hypothetical protein CC2G_005283 [Coprinopsis cinerea AmutBmut pab1-1]|nr:hypothetical protein CC2G_005283 [Coprinopsis cinerea AmutBmut pab1-1]
MIFLPPPANFVQTTASSASKYGFKIDFIVEPEAVHLERQLETFAGSHRTKVGSIRSDKDVTSTATCLNSSVKVDLAVMEDLWPLKLKNP